MAGRNVESELAAKRLACTIGQASKKIRDLRQGCGRVALLRQHQGFRSRQPESPTVVRAVRFVGVRRGRIAGRRSCRFSRSMLGAEVLVSRNAGFVSRVFTIASRNGIVDITVDSTVEAPECIALCSLPLIQGGLIVLRK